MGKEEGLVTGGSLPRRILGEGSEGALWHRRRELAGGSGSLAQDEADECASSAGFPGRPARRRGQVCQCRLRQVLHAWRVAVPLQDPWGLFRFAVTLWN